MPEAVPSRKENAPHVQRRAPEPAARGSAFLPAGALGIFDLQRKAGNRAVTGAIASRGAWLRGGPLHGAAMRHVQRVVDKTKAKKIDGILNNSVGWVSNSDLEKAWAELGTDLPEAINDPAFRSLWIDSVTKEGISLRDAGAPLIEQFKRDVLNTARARVNSQVGRMTALMADIDTPQKIMSSPAASDGATNQSVQPRKPVLATTVIDQASTLDFLMNWESILREVPVAVRRAPSTLLPAPGPKAQTAELGPFLAPAGANDQKLVTFDPTGDDARLQSDPSIEYLNLPALRAARDAWTRSTMYAGMYRARAAAMMAMDPNLAALAEAKSLGDVSKISRASEKDAKGSLKAVAKRNLESLERFQATLQSPPRELWKALGPVQQQLLSGDTTSSSRDWSDITAKGFIDDLFAHGKETASERDAARAKLVSDLVIGAAAFAAVLASGGALTTVFLATLDAAMVAAQARGSAEAGSLAGAVDNAARANMATPDAAARAREEADRKDGQLVAGIVLSVLPFLPQLKRGVTAGAAAVKNFLRASGTAARAGAAAEGAAPAVVATLRPRATGAQLREMLANKNEYASWATREEDVVKNATIKYMGKTNAAHPDEVLSLFKGIDAGVQYGPWKVIVRRQGKYLGSDAVSAAGEVKIPGTIDPQDSWWFHVDDLKGL